MDILCGGILQAGFQYLVNIFYVQMMIFHGVYSLLADCEGRSWRDISNSFIYLYLSVHINTRFPGDN